MGNHENPTVIPPRLEVVQETCGRCDNLPIALAAWKRQINVTESQAGKNGDWAAVQVAVVALSESLVQMNGNWRVGKGDLYGFHGATQVGDKYSRQIGISITYAEAGGKSTASSRQSTRQPPGSDAVFIILCQ